MANVKISNLPVETVLANMTGIAGYNASGTAQISGATIDSAFAKSTSDLQFIVDNGNAIDSNAGTGSIIFKNGGSNTNTTVSVNSISSDTSFSIIGTTNNTNLTFTSGGEIRFTPNASLGTPAIGDVLTAKSTGGAVEWTTPSAPTTYIGQQGADVEFYTDSFITIKWDETNNDIELRVNDWGTASSLNAMDRQDGFSSVEPDNTNIPSSTGTATFTPISPILGVNERAEILVAPVDFPWPTDTAGTTNWPTYKIEVMNNGSATSTNFYAIINKYNN